LPASILFEGRHLFGGRGSGIATYARGLNAVARSLGHPTRVLASVKRPPSAADPQYNEIFFF